MPTSVEIAIMRYSSHQDDYFDSRKALEFHGWQITGVSDDGESYLAIMPDGWNFHKIDDGDVVEYFDKDNKLQIRDLMRGQDGLRSFNSRHIVVEGYG